MKHLLLGLTGGIAAYKAAELTRELVRLGFHVQVVMTEAARRFIGAETLQALSGNPVFTDLWDSRIANNMGHIDLSRNCDAVVIAPASADFIAKIANGLADDLLSTLCLARACPLIIAPAKNRQMWENAATQRNLAQAQKDGVIVLGPASGEQACGETGMGRMLEPIELAQDLEAFFQPKLLAGKKVLVTAGPTFEAMDAVRGITNQSSGKMGYAVARAALEAGAQVTLISGPCALNPPAAAQVVNVVSAKQMLDAVDQRAGESDVFISVAAVSDFTVRAPEKNKIKKESGIPALQLALTQDILAHVASRKDAPFCVGFALESENLDELAEAKRRRKKLPLLAANLAKHALGEDESEIVLFDDAGRHPLPRAPKIEHARKLIAHIARLLTSKQ
ncbi:MAG: bifunctional phosphopantothenoylcysteine decarboxylase/phosphopantothenate--cysteine ligase CoaBC [Burkholderiales bacterium]